MSRLISGLMALVLAGSCFTCSFAEDWPQWLGVHRDGTWRETGIIRELPPDGLPVKWRVPIGPGYSGPSIAAGRVFVMDRCDGRELEEEEKATMKKAGYQLGGERVLCLDESTGKTLWKFEYDAPYRISYSTGPRCTPTVDGDRVYTLGAMGDLYCLQANDGKVIWHRRFSHSYTRDGKPVRPPVWGYSSHPVVDGDRLIVPVGGEGSAVVAFNKLTGDEIWRSLTSSDIAYAPLMIHSSTNDAGEQSSQLLFWHADGIDSIDPKTGEPYWHLKFPEKQTQPGATTSIITPQFVGDKMFVSEYFSGSLLLKINHSPPGYEELRRSITDDRKHERSLNALMSNPVIRNGLVFGLTGEGVMRCVKLESDELVWENREILGDEPQLFGNIFFIENEGRFFAADDLGRLSIVELDESGIRVLSRCQILEPTTNNLRGRIVVWSHPAFANRAMVCRNDSEIVSFDMAAQE